MRILVTGGAGFIGSNIVDVFLAAGHEVAVLDNLVTGRAEHLAPAAHFYQGDVRDADTVERVFRDFRPETLNHHAAQIDVRKSTVDPIFDAETNILGSLTVLQAARRHGVAKVLYASSGGAVYGEPEYLPADEAHPIRPICEYGVSKHTVEHYLHVYHVNYGLRYTALRYANVYGPRQNIHGDAGVIALFTGQMLAGEQPHIYGDGEAVRDYLYVGDAARANLCALTQGDGLMVNIGTGVGTSVNALYRLLATATHYAHPPVYVPGRIGEIAGIYLDNRLAAQALGWSPEVNLREGLTRTVAYVRAD
ncbi:MAG TPA: NAD-dependent epimerase/dehydratase family protein [Armatimonadota bacterium]|jgi:UDP-glucose 4-epimerase